MIKTTRALLAFAVLITFSGYLYVAIPTCSQFGAGCDDLHTAIIQHTATSPYRYRILAPFIVQAITPNVIPVGYALLHLIAFAILYPALYSWFKRWMNDDRAMLCVFITVACFWLGFNFYYLSAWSTLEVLFIALALVSLDKPLWIYALLVGLGALNRETTGIILIALFVFYHKNSLYGVLLFTGHALITLSLHLTFGNAPLFLTIAETLQRNLQLAPQAIVANLPLLPLVFLVTVNYRHSTPYLKRLVLIACGYTCALIVAATWLEFPRLMLSIMPLVLPMVLGRERTTVDEAYKLVRNDLHRIMGEPL